MIYNGIRVQSDNEVITFSASFLQEIQVTDMEQVEGTGNVNNLIARLLRKGSTLKTCLHK